MDLLDVKIAKDILEFIKDKDISKTIKIIDILTNDCPEDHGLKNQCLSKDCKTCWNTAIRNKLE